LPQSLIENIVPLGTFTGEGDMPLTTEQEGLLGWIAANYVSIGEVPSYMWNLLPKESIRCLFRDRTEEVKIEIVEPVIAREVVASDDSRGENNPASEIVVAVKSPAIEPAAGVKTAASVSDSELGETADLWSAVKTYLRRNVLLETYESFFSRLEFERIENGTVVISTATLSTRRFLEKYYYNLLCSAIVEYFPEAQNVVIGHRCEHAGERHIANPYRARPVPLPAPNTVLKVENVAQAASDEPTVTPDVREMPQSSREKRELCIKAIIAVVARHYDVKVDVITSYKRDATIVRARHIAMYLTSVLLPQKSSPEIGHRFGGRYHTTVLHAVRKIALLCADDASTNQEIEALISKIKEDFIFPVVVNETPNTETTPHLEAAE